MQAFNGAEQYSSSEYLGPDGQARTPLIKTGGLLQGRKLREVSHSRFRRLLLGVLMLAVPLFFSALGILIAYLDGKVADDFRYENKDVIFQVTKSAASAFQIAFTMILGTLLHLVALRKAETGTRIGQLEKLLGSKTIGSAIKALFAQHFLMAWSIGLVLLWSLSPLGAQAVLRAVNLEASSRDRPVDIAFHPTPDLSIATNPNNLSDNTTTLERQDSFLGDVKADFKFIGAAFAPYTALHLIRWNESDTNDPVSNLGGLQDAIKISQRDVWDKIRIPYLEYLNGYDAETPYQWLGVPNDSLTVYESLVGMQLIGLSNELIANTTVNVEASYPTFDCEQWSNLTEWLPSHDNELLENQNLTEDDLFQSPDFNGRISDIMLDIWTPPNDSGPSQLLVGYNSSKNEDIGNRMTLCKMNITYIDLTIFCLGSVDTGSSTCSATRARHSARFSSQAGSSPAPDMLTVFNSTQLSNLPVLLSTDNTNTSFLFAEWLTNLGLATNSPSYTNLALTELEPAFLNARLGYLINTYWRLSLPGGGSGGAGIEGYSKYADAGAIARDNPYYVFVKGGGADGPTASVLYEDSYRVSWVWLWLYIGCSATMLLCALGVVWLRTRVKAPDIFAGVAGLAWDSRFLAIDGGAGGGWSGTEKGGARGGVYGAGGAAGGSAMSSQAKAFLLKDRWVRIQDVKPSEAAGRIALSDQTMTLDESRLDWERMYE